jgi:hypothetical protein
MKGKESKAMWLHFKLLYLRKEWVKRREFLAPRLRIEWFTSRTQVGPDTTKPACSMIWVKSPGCVNSIPASYLETPGSAFVPDFVWFFSDPPRKCWDSTVHDWILPYLFQLTVTSPGNATRNDGFRIRRSCLLDKSLRLQLQSFEIKSSRRCHLASLSSSGS